MFMFNFSKREAQVVRLVLKGKSNKQIAAALGVSEGTIEMHLTSIYTKVGVRSRVELILRFGQLGITPDDLDPEKLGKPAGEMHSPSGESPGEKPEQEVYDGDEKQSAPKGRGVAGKRKSPTSSRAFLALLGITLVFGAAVVLYRYLSLPRAWEGYERECEYTDQSTVGQAIGRSNASGEQVHGQFGAISVEPWTAMPGEVFYQNISMPKVEHLYIKLRYSKNSLSSAPILIYLDGEEIPRASFYPQNLGDWNHFVWSDPIYLGSIESGVHGVRLSTVGQQYGVADLDMFVLTAGSP